MTGALTILALAAPTRAQWHVRNSPHDLSRSGPGPVRAVDEGQVCVFCHTPHNAAPDTPLWNRFNAPRHYRIYQSSTTDARIDQPTGDSKLCLSCHDGVLAVGLLRSRGETDIISTTIERLREDHGGLGTDLSDDHPISFRFDRALAAADRQLRNPDTISSYLPLGKHGDVECTTCHDAHDNRHGDFLRLTKRESTICMSCHQMDGWRIGAHGNSHVSITGRDVDPNETLEYHTVGENGCLNCHKIHTAPQHERLLRFRREEDNCLNCHSGRVGRHNILSDIRKRSAHNPRKYMGVHDAAEDPAFLRRHVECVDCHNPHAAAGTLLPREISLATPGPKTTGPEMRFASGLSASGRALDHARFEYEVCLKCHSVGADFRSRRMDRSVNTADARRQFRTSNPSYHPVFGTGRNKDVPSLASPLRPGSMIGCTDCHDSDNARGRGGSGPNGPHGSVNEPLLAERYVTRDFSVESGANYALCYRCHERSSILGNESFPLHRLHVVSQRTPCAVCHDPHGVPAGSRHGDHTNLINFDNSVVEPSDFSRRIEYRDTGRLRGTCTLRCHNFNHENITYQR
ncbi:MAG TPA: cytochrome c3 family protein [Phycisphaerae bacterium]|nr:cytochrome c3 family protein [Phycisphaerae bacterium]